MEHNIRSTRNTHTNQISHVYLRLGTLTSPWVIKWEMNELDIAYQTEADELESSEGRESFMKIKLKTYKVCTHTQH